ncbi:YpdA family putative bacillithiol disulfide reductase [Bhargavaea beijingensis]|uniref:YpdA family putative bacillithiol disulfide reductase n=1 Tax=Bhargavaea beijingensis TaxID=426756 RepID=A0ABX9ZH48_9BACL|nr:YpdA family putative bacillithiol disulfide reductase [Bhargavaea beijingensis]MCW1928210.1 YpdA family putative bacillithiol disulfide reductase [Bhargavaea beijingensis]RSK37917.1 YpdA family putative bacillithiol disulfide reductase [Bhargavaea beijingensis]
MQQEEAVIIGGGPCGIAAAIALQDEGIRPLIIEKGNVVNTIYNYPTHQTFFSSSEKLSVGDIPFITERLKPKRNEALVYYREVVRRKQLRVHRFERVESVEKDDGGFVIKTDKGHYRTSVAVVATGYYDNPNYLGIPGENLPKVFHYFKEAHPFFDTDVLVIGGKNSAVDAAIELNKAGARVTVSYRGKEYSPSVKPWVLPEFDALVRNGAVDMRFGTVPVRISEEAVELEDLKGNLSSVPNDFVFAMTGYHPDHTFLRKMGIGVDDETGRPKYDPETMETAVPGLFIAGVIAAGNNANEIFIENGRFHGGLLARKAIEYVK